MIIYYHDLYNKQFEDLVVVICQNLLGIGVQKFSTGPDGGRDARFIGLAQNFPSTVDPLSGKFIIQAKHTEGIADKYSDLSFSSESANSIISNEIVRLKKLKKVNDIDHYLLFSNRRLSGNINTLIENRIVKEANICSAHLIGIEKLDLFIKKWPEVINLSNVNLFDEPLHIDPLDLAEIILALSKNKDQFKTIEKPIKRVKFKEKNVINMLSKEYALVIQEQHIMYFSSIKNFLSQPENSNLLTKYRDTVEEFNLQIIAHKKDFTTFDDILNKLYSLLINRDHDLKKNKQLTRTVLFYMYWNCDVGTER